MSVLLYVRLFYSWPTQTDFHIEGVFKCSETKWSTRIATIPKGVDELIYTYKNMSDES
jgi:hypothetical protein